MHSVEFKPQVEQWQGIEQLLNITYSYTAQQLIQAYQSAKETIDRKSIKPDPRWMFVLMFRFKKTFGKSPIYYNKEEHRLSWFDDIIYENGTFKEISSTNSRILSDQKRLSQFVKEVGNGKGFNDLDNDVKQWWMNRY